MSTKKRVYIPKNKTNGQIKGKRKIWVENVKFLTLEEYDQLRETIKLHSRPELVNRNLLLIAIALNNGLRASDVVTLRVGHVLNKTKTRVIEQKTGKAKTLFWNNCLAEIIDYLNDLDYKDENDYLFPGKQEGHFSVHGFYEMLQRMARKTENNKIFANIGTHSFRKTFGRQLYKKGVNVEIISQLFNHSSERNTRHYLGIEQEDLDKVVQNFKFE